MAARHAVSLLSFAPPGLARPPAELSGLCRTVEFVPAPGRSRIARLKTLMRGRADMAARLWSLRFEQALRRTLAAAAFDLIQVEGLEMAAYLNTIRQCAPQTAIVYDAHNAEVMIQQRAWHSDRRTPSRWPVALYSWLQVPRLAQFEAAICRQASAVTCVSEVDANALRRPHNTPQPVVVPNGLDLFAYAWPPPPLPSAPVLTFTGKMDYRPNVDAAVWFAREILPLVRQRQAGARFEVVGQKPAPAVATLSGQAGVSIVGAVPDVRPYISGSAVYVAPLRMGGGTRFKLLEALALGRPVVTTTIGAEGFLVQSGRELLIADTPSEFAAAIARVLEDPEFAGRLIQAGRAFVEANYDWEAILPRLEAVYQHLAGGQPALAS